LINNGIESGDYELSISVIYFRYFVFSPSIVIPLEAGDMLKIPEVVVVVAR